MRGRPGGLPRWSPHAGSPLHGHLHLGDPEVADLPGGRGVEHLLGLHDEARAHAVARPAEVDARRQPEAAPLRL
eukprot:3744536-Alexandrium_andersonii.AAC.1